MGGEKIAVHDRVRDVVASLGRAAGLKVFVEVRGLVTRPRQGLESGGGVVDVVLVRDDGTLQMVDVVVADPCCPSYVERASRRDLAAAAVAITRKEREYAGRLAGTSFTPFALESFGALSAPADSLLQELAACASRRSGSAPCAVLLEYFRRRVSVGLQRAESQCLLGRAHSLYAMRCRVVDLDRSGLPLSSAQLRAQVRLPHGA